MFDYETMPLFQVQFHSKENPDMLRNLQSNQIGKMVVIPGIITAASKAQIRATKLVVKCSSCGHEKTIKLQAGFGGAMIPRQCDNARNQGPDKQMCKLDSYQTYPDKCSFID